MPAPTIRYYELKTQGNGLIAQLRLQGGAGTGPEAALVTTMPFGTTLGGSWVVKTFVIGFENNTADQLGFWLYDPISDVNGVLDAENFFDGVGNWSFRARVSSSYIGAFSDSAILSAPWTDLPYGVSATPWDLNAAILALNPGNNGTTNLLVDSVNFASTKLTNAFLYVAVKPDVTAIAGDHQNWGFRTTFVYP
jgi:hypothetical protein